MSYGQDQPRVYLLNIETGQRELVGNFPGMTFAPRFSPDGQSIVMSLEDERQREHLPDGPPLEAGRRGSPTRRRSTPSPSYSPDCLADHLHLGSRRQPADLRDGRRRLQSDAHLLRPGLLFDAGVVAARRPDRLHPPGRRSSFAIGVMRPDGSGERILTEGYHNEGPTWAPNGRVLMFFRDVPGRRAGRSCGRSI